jgi:hypothetical protein
VEYLGIWTFGDVNCTARPQLPQSIIVFLTGPGPGVIKGRGYMERPQNRQGSCLGTWEGPGDGRSRLAAFFCFFLFLGFLGLN